MLCVFVRFIKSNLWFISMAMRKKEGSSSLILDNFDIFCLIDIHQCKLDKKRCDTSYITKSFFKEESQEENSRLIYDKMNFVSGRLKNMINENVVLVARDEKNKKLFKLNYNNIALKKCKFPGNKFKESVYIKNKGKKWTVFEI